MFISIPLFPFSNECGSSTYSASNAYCEELKPTVLISSIEVKIIALQNLSNHQRKGKQLGCEHEVPVMLLRA